METARNEVRLKVRGLALDLGKFTVEELHDVTGLNVASIRTELMRMKQAGYLTSEPIAAARRGRGAPAHRFHLTTDPAKLDQLNASIARFTLGPPKTISEPRGLNYERARHLIERLEIEGDWLVPVRRDALAADAVACLELAEQDMGLGVNQDQHSAVLAAYVDMMHARLALATQRAELVEECLREALATFERHGLEQQLHECEVLQDCADLEIAVPRSGTADTAELQRFAAVLNELRGDLPAFLVRRTFFGMLGKAFRPPAVSETSPPPGAAPGSGAAADSFPSLTETDKRKLTDLASSGVRQSHVLVDAETSELLARSELIKNRAVRLRAADQQAQGYVLNVVEFTHDVHQYQRSGKQIGESAEFLHRQLQLQCLER